VARCNSKFLCGNRLYRRGAKYLDLRTSGLPCHAFFTLQASLGQDESSMDATCDANNDSGEASCDPDLAQAVDMGVPQFLEGGNVLAAETSERIQKARQYMESVDAPQDLKDLCRNKHEMCSIWSVQGECQVNPTCECQDHENIIWRFSCDVIIVHCAVVVSYSRRLPYVQI
jgi:hypothetical protein